MIQLYSVNTNDYEKNESRHNLDRLRMGYTLITDNSKPDRSYKMLPHNTFHSGITVYCDANMTLVKPEELLRLCNNLENSDASAIFFSHPQRTTSRSEIAECIKRGLLKPDALTRYNEWRAEGFKDTIPLMENNVLIRKTFDDDLIKCEEIWYNEYKNGIKRDQPSLPYAMWKSGYSNFILMDQSVKERIFKWRHHRT